MQKGVLDETTRHSPFLSCKESDNTMLLRPAAAFVALHPSLHSGEPASAMLLGRESFFAALFVTRGNSDGCVPAIHLYPDVQELNMEKLAALKHSDFELGSWSVSSNQSEKKKVRKQAKRHGKRSSLSSASSSGPLAIVAFPQITSSTA